MNGSKLDDENRVDAFVQDETESTWAFLRNGLIAATVFVAVLLVGAVCAVVIWTATR